MEEKKEPNDLQKKAEEYLDGWKRERAGFINYKKEEAKRTADLIKYSQEELLFKILPILDNFDIAEQHLSDAQKSDEHVKGLLLIKQQMTDFLKSNGVVEMSLKIGDRFDPNIHEATEEVVAKDEKSGIIIKVIQKGYLISGRLLRPAKVKVSK